MAAQKRGARTGRPYALETFILGRSRLENQGCVSISKALAVRSGGIYQSPLLLVLM